MPKSKYVPQVVAIFILLALGLAVAASVGTRSPESDLAAPGAPLYEIAVTESVHTLMSKEEQAELGALSRPPSPGPDYYWCENCKTYHLRQAPGAQPVPPGGAPAGPHAAAAPQAQQVAGVRPPSPGPGYYWCENCKTYHLRQAPGAHPVPPGGVPAGPHAAAAPQAQQVAGVRPPSPGPGYYWCEKCKTYHRRPAEASDRVDVSRIVGGISNRPNMNPLVGPAGMGP